MAVAGSICITPSPIQAGCFGRAFECTVLPAETKITYLTRTARKTVKAFAAASARAAPIAATLQIPLATHFALVTHRAVGTTLARRPSDSGDAPANAVSRHASPVTTQRIYDYLAIFNGISSNVTNSNRTGPFR